MSIQGKLCLVTGANSGMGRAAAVALARQNAHVIVACRDERKAQATRDELVAESGNASIEYLWGDLSSRGEIHSLAETFHERHEHLDILLNNAGMIAGPRTLTEEGIETTFAVNHLGPFMLTLLLLPALLRVRGARIVTVASEVHRIARFDPNNLQLERGYGAYRAYALSKLANIMFTHELAKRLEGTGISATCCHPGYVGSNFGRNADFPFRTVMSIVRPFLTASEKGSDTAVYLATSAEVEGKSGGYYIRRRKVSPSRVATDDRLTAQLWEISKNLAGLANDPTTQIESPSA